MQQTDTRLSTKWNDWNDKRIQTDHRCRFFSPIPDAYLCVRVDLAPDKKNVWKIRTGPPGCWAFGP